jgi:N-acetylglucosaminyldiphosphoundecaprenol N-acetyl-beta-D-mannosaminyltransferase
MHSLKINKQIEILHVRIDLLSRKELLEHFKARIESKQKTVALGVNTQLLNFSYSIPGFNEMINKADFLTCDGVGVIWAAKMTGQIAPERIPIMEWIEELLEQLNTLNGKVFLVGTKEDTIKKAEYYLRSKFSNLAAVESHHGFFDREKGSLESQKVIDKINSINPDLLLVCMGNPIQEQWVFENLQQIKAIIIFPCGATCDNFGGLQKRAHSFFIQIGHEWLGRLLNSPQKFWKRYLIGNPMFLLRALWW